MICYVRLIQVNLVRSDYVRLGQVISGKYG
jgi:hypothetical protein